MNYITRLILRAHPGPHVTGHDLLHRAGLHQDTLIPGYTAHGAWKALRSLVESGFLYKTGTSDATEYGLTAAGHEIRATTLPPLTPAPEDAMPQHGHWTQQHSGAAFDLLNPRAHHVHWSDITLGLSRESRWNGQTTHPYTVAQHTILVCAILHEQGADRDTLTGGLLHDAAEAYLKDIPTPLKALIPAYKGIERAVTQAITTRFGARPLTPLHPDIRAADRLALHAEAWTLFPSPPLNGWAGPRDAATLGPYATSVLHLVEDDRFWRAQLNELAAELGIA